MEDKSEINEKFYPRVLESSSLKQNSAKIRLPEALRPKGHHNKNESIFEKEEEAVQDYLISRSQQDIAITRSPLKKSLRRDVPAPRRLDTQPSDLGSP